MKWFKIGIFSLLISFFSFGCSSDSDRAPSMMEHKKVEFYFTSANGKFSHLKGYRRYVYFQKDGTYEFRTRSGILEDSGSYSYDKDDDNEGEITMLSDYGKNAGDQVLFKLHFSSSKSGRFEGTMEQGNAAGDVGGRFKFKKMS